MDGSAPLQAPFPYFGGKRKVADIVWDYLGDVDTYIEPFFGSGAVLLSRPHSPKTENINDSDGLLANFWRAIIGDPEETARHADWPVNECDLHARHLWLVGQRQELTERLMADPEFYDPKAAGWWVWGICSWIGSGWCSGNGPWQAGDGVLTDSRQLPHMGNAGQGINRQLPHMGNAGQGINRQRPHMSRPNGAGINNSPTGNPGDYICDWFTALSQRLRRVRVACGDWSRVTGPSVRRSGGAVCGVFLDPPYAHDLRDNGLYAVESSTVARDCLEWAKAHGSEKNLRIVLAGYDGEHNDLTGLGWRALEWKAQGGYGNQGDGRGAGNCKKERLWISPNCLAPESPVFQESLAL
jgi:site-specific DNA-adenine methylase